MKQAISTRLTGMGIGPRIVLIFALAFSVMGGLGLVLMRISLLPTFERMEAQVALEKSWRVVSSIEHQMLALADLNSDWAIWDDISNHVQARDVDFDLGNFSPEALHSSKFHAVLLLDHNNAPYSFGAKEFSTGALAQAQEITSVIVERTSRSPLRPKATECGAASIAGVLNTLCWTGVLPSNGQGPIMGTLVMIRELDAATQKSMIQYAGTPFSLNPFEPNHPVAPESLEWELAAFKYLTHKTLRVQYSDNSLAMQYLLHDINDHPLVWVNIQLDRELMEQGRKVIRDVLIQLAVVALVTGLVLLVTVQWWLVRPITRLRRSVTIIGETKGWHMRLVVDRPDEIGALAKGINGLLEVLRTHVDALTKLSSTDALTGIANRRQFDARLADELARLGRRTGPLSLLLMDVDHFKSYNDRYGHPQGDEVLRQLGVLLKASCRKQDLPARVGGEEFALILPDTDDAGAIAMADKIMKALAAMALEHDTSTTDRVVTVSIGATTWNTPQNGGADTLYVQADKALYAAKQLGRNRVCTFDSSSATSI